MNDKTATATTSVPTDVPNGTGTDAKKHVTVGTIKTIDLTNHTFTLEPIATYRFQTKDDDENSWMIVFKEESNNPPELKLINRDAEFKFEKELISGLILVKQNKTRISVKAEIKNDSTNGDESDEKPKWAIDSQHVEIVIQ